MGGVKPAITAPLSRFLAVADLERSIGFYHDVLGFEMRPVERDAQFPALAELGRGPARIQLGTMESALDSTGESRPRGSAILFLETDDVAGLRAAIMARGGSPSELEKVNWIKMRMFEIRDPDGHTLWFGQSFQEPDVAKDSFRQIRQLLPELPLSNVPAGVEYYQNVLGFRINFAGDDFGVMDRDDVTLILIPRTELHTGIGSCYAYVRDVDALHAELLGRGARVQGEPISHPWGLRDFQVLDLEGNRITLGQPFE
jgi:catechol 2,3-dioxygenase-like lactoylglutathione lyase family enzyme